MAPEKAPAFQFYPKDFLSDSNVLEMSMLERGVYITLLCICWTEGSLPSAADRLANMVSIPPKQFAKCWPVIRECFTERDGRYVHLRLDREREKQAEHRRRQSDKGSRGAEKRWQRDSTGIATAIAQAIPDDGSSSASASAISDQPTAVAAAMPRYIGKQKPIPGYRRLKVFPFMVEEIMGMLGDRAVDFDLDKWLLELDSSGRVLPPNIWPWMKEAVSADASMRGFGPAALVKGTHTNIDAVRDILRRDGVIE